MIISCEYNTPLTASGTVPVEGEVWQFSNVNCDYPYFTLIENGEGQQFYVNEQINYGDFIIIVFLLIFLLIFLAKIIWDFLVPVNFKALTKNDL